VLLVELWEECELFLWGLERFETPLQGVVRMARVLETTRRCIRIMRNLM